MSGKKNCFLVALALAACGGGESPSNTPPPAASSAAPAPHDPPPDASASAKPVDPPPPPPDKTKPSEQLARDMIRTGRKIAYSATKKSIAYQVRWSVAGSGFGVRIAFAGEDGKETGNQVVCQPQDCDQSLDEKLDAESKKLGEKLEADGYVSVASNGWAASLDELEIASQGLKLAWTKDKIELVEDKKRKSLGTFTVKKPDTAHPAAVFVIKEASLLVVDFALSGDKHELKVFKLPK